MSNRLERWFENKKMSSFRDLAQAENAFDRFFHEMLNMKKRDGLEFSSFSPSCDVIEEDKSYMLKFDLPGITKDQVHVEVDQDRLTVHAERREEKTSDSKKKHVSEVFYGTYTRSFSLPGPVDEKKIDAKFDNGVLTVKIPKAENSKSKQIPVQ